MKKAIVLLSAVALFGAMLVIGCAKPPTDKVAALTDDFAKLQTIGAPIFAQAEYDAVNGKMSTLQGLMDSKKYKEATALCDSIATDIANLKTTVSTQGAEMAKTEVAGATEEIAKLKTLVTDNAKALGTEDGKKFADQVAALESQAGGLQGAIDGGDFLKAYNDAKSIKDMATAATTEIGAKMEAAKAKKGAKPAKPAKKK